MHDCTLFVICCKNEGESANQRDCNLCHFWKMRREYNRAGWHSFPHFATNEKRVQKARLPFHKARCGNFQPLLGRQIFPEKNLRRPRRRKSRNSRFSLIVKTGKFYGVDDRERDGEKFIINKRKQERETQGTTFCDETHIAPI